MGLAWRLFVDTAAAAPGDVYPEADGPPPQGTLLLEHHSLRCYIAGRPRSAAKTGRRTRGRPAPQGVGV